jgi:ribosomal protein S27AE
MPKLTHAQRRRIAPPCTIEGCGRPQEILSKGLCELHLRRLKTHGSLEKPKHWRAGTARENRCDVPGCEKPRHERGTYCAGHGHRARRYGNPTFDPIAARRRQCSNDGCETLTTAKHGLCVKHARKFYSEREKGTEKRAARIAAGGAIATGRLVKQPCEKCGAERVHAHHDDYSKPLDVRWLCPKHHAEEHG